jgi:hypothetical protein
MPLFTDWFGRSINNFPYTEKRKAEIQSTRVFFAKELLFDKLLVLFEIDPLEYPPLDPTGHEITIQKILDNENHGLNLKHCLV